MNQDPVMRILLTGSTGFLGCHLVRAFVEEMDQVEVYCLVRGISQLESEQRLFHILKNLAFKKSPELYSIKVVQ